MIKPRIGIISSVPADPFKNLDFAALQFDSQEQAAAMTPEIKLFLDTLDKEYSRQSGIQFDIIRALDGNFPKHGDYDAYLLGGSPAMVKDNKPWIKGFLDFVNTEVNNGTPVLGMCFGHQILVSAFGGEVDEMEGGRVLGPSSIMVNANGQGDEIFSQIDKEFTSLYSHKQSVKKLGEAEVLGSTSHDPYTIVKVGNDAWGVQFHPEFKPETVSFLAKLMKGTLEKEGIDMNELISKARAQEGNEGSKVIQLFLKKYWNK